MTATADEFIKLHNRQLSEGTRGQSFSFSSDSSGGCYDECMSLVLRNGICYGFMFDRFKNNCTIFDTTPNIKFVEIAVGTELYIKQIRLCE